jgi:hypothetical protein
MFAFGSNEQDTLASTELKGPPWGAIEKRWMLDNAFDKLLALSY